MRSPELRIGDREREAAVAALGEHYVAGRLTKEELDERTAGAWVARTNSELAPLFVDLPPLYDDPVVVPVAPRLDGRLSRPGMVPLLVLVGLVLFTKLWFVLLVLLGSAMFNPVSLVLLVAGVTWVTAVLRRAASRSRRASPGPRPAAPLS
jgi:hypothetical protein